MRTQLIQVHDTHQLPIQITELGALHIRRWRQRMLRDGSVARAQIHARGLPHADRPAFVERYAWYTGSCAGGAAAAASARCSARAERSRPSAGGGGATPDARA